MSTMYDKYFTKDQLMDMRASTSSKIRNKEETMMGMLLLFLFIGFVESILAIAMMFWFNKFTIFLVTIGLLVLIPIFLFYIATLSDWRKTIKMYGGSKKPIDKEEL